jgi:hypothetical protein
MDETYRMLGREHQADLEGEAAKWRRAQELHVTARPQERTRQRFRGRLATARYGKHFVWWRLRYR